MSGLTATGLVIETPDEIRTSINEAMVVAFGPQLDLTDGSLQGKVIGIVSDHIGQVWEALEAVYDARDPDAAVGAALDAICALSGTRREAAAASTATLTLTGTPTTAVPAGSQVSIVDAPDAVFATDALATIGAALTAWAPSTAYVIGDRRRNNVGGPDRCYIVTSSGTSGAQGPSGTGAGIADNTVVWHYLGDGTGLVDTDATATETGPLIAQIYSITSIVTPVSGWLGVINLADAIPGQKIESDELLRVRRELELASAGTTPPEPLREDLLAVADVTSVRIFNNPTDSTDADGVPPHSFEALIVGGDDQDLWDAIYASGPTGVQSFGDEVGNVTDSQGFVHSVAFSRPDPIAIYVDIVLVKNVTASLGPVYPSDGDAQVKTAVALFGNALGVGRDVVATQLIGAVYGITGVISVSVPEIDDAPTPTTSTTVVLTEHQIATFSTANITVATSNGTP